MTSEPTLAVSPDENEDGQPAEQDVSGLQSLPRQSRVAAEETLESAVELEAEPASTSPGAEATAEATPLLAGRFDLYENGLSVRMSLNGVVNARAWQGNRSRSIRVPLVDSGFEIQMRKAADGVEFLAGDEVIGRLEAPAESFTLDAPDVDGLGGLLLHDPERPESVIRSAHFAPGTLDVSLAVRSAATSTLVVVAEGSGEPLSEVDVYFVNDSFVVATYPVGQNTVELAKGESSPVLLQPSGSAARSKAATLLVRARGYAWEKITVNLAEPGERRVELTPSGSLQLEFDGVLPKRASLRLFQGDDLFADLRARETSMTLSGLPPALYQVSLQVGKWFNQPATFGEQEVEITAGQESRLRLTLEPEAVAITAAFSGTLVVPPAWDIPRHSVTLRRLTPSATGAKGTANFKGDRLPAVPGQDGHFSFTLPELETGTYAITYFQANYKEVFEHLPEGTQDYRLSVPPPTDVIVRVVLEGTDESPDDIERILWSPARPEGARGGRMDSVNQDPVSREFRLRVPEGEFSVLARSRGYRSEEAKFDTQAGAEFTVEVRRTAVAHVELRSQGTLIPWPEGFSVDIITPSGEAESAGLAMRGDERRFTVETPGSYQVLGPEVEGFLPPEPVTADLVLGEERTVVIELVAR